MGMQSILINHLGYEVGAPKCALVASPATSRLQVFELIGQGGAVELERPITYCGGVDGWKGRFYWKADFGPFDKPGEYTLRVPGLLSDPFTIAPRLLAARTVMPMLDYFRSQRCRAPWDESDRTCQFFGRRSDCVDVHGGWHDASGDVSKYLSHLSYANFMNPQQTPLVVYNLLWARDLFAARPDATRDRRLEDEAAYGGDFLVRMQDPTGYFYMTVFDGWTKALEQRQICTFKTQQGLRLESYQSGYRQGGGMAIAALARLASSGHTGEFRSGDYLAAAARGFQHLEVHNVEYLDDGKENIIDDYCGLLAAAELFACTRERAYYAAAHRRAGNLLARLGDDDLHPGLFRADNLARPFFHASDAGLPALSLLRWAELTDSDDERLTLREHVATAMRCELEVTDAVSNPFGYARQWVKPLNSSTRQSFFFPHDNESGYWWQGENARLGSLAALGALALRDEAIPNSQRDRVARYCRDQLDWILGKNPFDSCMLHGFGRNNVEYMSSWPNERGGICNGITAGFFDENDVGFCEDNTPQHSWRWSEQWLPHAAWFLLAVAALSH